MYTIGTALYNDKKVELFWNKKIKCAQRIMARVYGQQGSFGASPDFYYNLEDAISGMSDDFTEVKIS